MALDGDGSALFSAEYGPTERGKIARLLRGRPRTRLVYAKQATQLNPFEKITRQAGPKRGRNDGVKLLSYPAEATDYPGSEMTIIQTCQR